MRGLGEKRINPEGMNARLPEERGKWPRAENEETGTSPGERELLYFKARIDETKGVLGKKGTLNHEKLTGGKLPVLPLLWKVPTGWKKIKDPCRTYGRKNAPSVGSKEGTWGAPPGALGTLGGQTRKEL